MREAGRYGVASAVLVVATALMCPPRATAQIDLSGEWSTLYHEDAPHRGAGPELADYTGLPLNEAGRLKAESWDASILSLRERQCIPHISTYALRGPATIRMWKVNDPATGRAQSYHVLGSYGRPRTIWMDGRAHPSAYAPHTWTGFSTGTWDGQTLVVTTTHLKTGWLQRNGAAHSDLVTMTERFTRHDKQLLIVTMLDDPIYLEEPFIRTTNFALTLTGNPDDWGSCGPAVNEVAGHDKSYVPHYLPGQNPYLATARAALHLTEDGAGGGAATMYPEYGASGRQGRPPVPAPRGSLLPDPAGAAVQTFPLRNGVYLLATRDGNVTVQAGDQGVLVVDSGPASVTPALMEAIRAISDKPIRFLLNTNARPNHTGGNEAIAKVGVRLRTSGGANSQGGVYQGPSIVAHESVLLAMSAPTGEKAALPTAAWPSDTFFTDEHEVVFNGDAIQLFHQPATTNGDTLMFFRRADVVVAGDAFTTTGYPVIDAARQGSVRGVLAALNRIIELTIPIDWQEGGTIVVPAQGRLADEADVVEYRDMVTIVHERVAALVKKGSTLAQVKAARPTLDYDGRYGAAAGPWTTDMFIEAVYRDVGGK
jgi:cyclase